MSGAPYQTAHGRLPRKREPAGFRQPLSGDAQGDARKTREGGFLKAAHGQF
jgi:hypothetical protein